MGTLFVVGTPIGNLEDVTLRALRILKEVDAILCEDTRVTAKLLARYEIRKPLVSYHEHSKRPKTAEILEMLREGKNLALVTDAGTPGISDPGARLVAAVRSELLDVRIEVIPGPSALTAALSVSGIAADEFVFLGFLPHKKGRKTALDGIAREKRPVVLYESPHRIQKLMNELAERVPEWSVVVARELTKIHEQIVSGKVSEIQTRLENGTIPARGEFVVILTPFILIQ